MLNRLLSILTALFFLTVCTTVQARPVTIEFTATIDYVDDYDNVFNGSLISGQTITGKYSFDTNLVDNDTFPESAYYTYQPPVPTGVGFELNVGGSTFTQSQNTYSFLNMHVYNATNGGDSFSVSHCCGGEVGTLSNGAIVNDIYMDFYSAGTDAINTTLLDDVVGAISNFQYKQISINGSSPYGGWYYIGAKITSVKEINSTASCSEPVIIDGTLGFKARVIDIYEDNPTQASPYKVGETITGAYNFDPNLADSDPSPEFGSYQHVPGDPQGSLSLEVSGSVVSSDPLSTWINIFINDSVETIGSDHFHIMSRSSNIQLPDGSVIYDVGLDLYDPNGSALSSASMPDGIPASMNGFQYRDLFIYGMKPDGSYFHINAVLESITNSTATTDKPASALQVSPGTGPVVMSQNFDVGIVVDAGYSPVTFIDANLTDMYGGTFYINCNTGPASPDGRQTIICPDITRYVSPGSNTLSVTVNFIDGVPISENITWDVVGY